MRRVEQFECAGASNGGFSKFGDILDNFGLKIII